MTTQTIYELIIKADEGDKQAMNSIHNYYCLEQDKMESYEAEFIQLLMDRANQNKPYSLLQLALMNILKFKVRNTPKDFEQDFHKGIDLLEKSMKAGCSEAYYVMAMLVLMKQTVHEMDYYKLLSIAMDMKNSSAYIQKGTEYSDTDFKKSVEHYKKAIKLDNDYAIYRLGQLYHDNKKYKLAIKYYNLAMDKNVHHAFFNLAVMYREGEGVNVDLVKAKELFKKAMELGNIRAITCIGGLYEGSDDIDKAKKYYKMAIDKNDTFAKYNLGLIYKGDDKHKKAIKCFIDGAKDGHPASEKILIYDYCITKLDMTDKEIDQLLDFHHVFKDFGAYDGFLSR